MNDQVIGTCSICSGRVTVPLAWWGIIPPVPTCEGCGATAREHNAPVIDMERPTYTSDRVVIDSRSSTASGAVFGGQPLPRGVFR